MNREQIIEILKSWGRFWNNSFADVEIEDLADRLEQQPISEERIEEAYTNNLTTIDNGIHLESQMFLDNFKAALKELTKTKE